jgi:hypothetical protein
MNKLKPIVVCWIITIALILGIAVCASAQDTVYVKDTPHGHLKYWRENNVCYMKVLVFYPDGEEQELKVRIEYEVYAYDIQSCRRIIARDRH